MELIQPAEISGKIMTLLDQSKTTFTIVSPYNKISSWKKLTLRIAKAIERGVEIKWYIRKNVENNIEQIQRLGIQPIEIENLHCKLYLNEHQAIVTSMNLHEFSDTSSLDIGYLINEKEKYDELIAFIANYIQSNSDKKLVQISPAIYISNKQPINVDIDLNDKSFYNILYDSLSDYKTYFESKEMKVGEYGNSIIVKGFFKYFDLIFEPRGSYFRIDLRINGDFQTKKKIYNYLLLNEPNLISKLKINVNYGSTMRRLKIDLDIFEHYKYDKWSEKEFKILEQALNPIINTFILEFGSDKFKSIIC